ncbi:hypothetical protein BGW39_010331 [Mortierella sp. 14UC]|nr:hypothetical protein BGW39_010331 [Mortierella sp. 14UC]
MYQQQYQQQAAQQPRQQQHQQHHAGGQGHQNRDPVDPFQARQLYRNELASLTFNSKPIITSLTISAGENVSVSKVIVQTIEERLRTAPANQKLPALYLIDSIIKNVGGPYLNLFARTIVTLFLDAYAVVDSSAKASFEKVLGTWPNWNTQLFPKELIAKIEHGVRSMRQQKQGSYQPSTSHGKPHYPDRSREDSHSQSSSNMFNSNGPQNRPTPPPAAPVESSSDAGLLKDIQLLMLQKSHAMIMNPADQASAKQVGILQQLESLVKTTQLTPESSNIIRQQLAQLWTPAPTPPVMPVFPPAGMPAVSSPMPLNMLPGSMPPLQPPQPPSMPLPPNLPFPPPHFPPQLQPGSIPSPHMMGAPVTMPIPPAGLPMSGGMPMPIPPRSMPMPMPTMPAMPLPTAPAGPPATNLFASLMQSGLLGPNGALTNLNRNPQSPLMGGTPPPPMPVPLPVASVPAPASTATLDRADQSEQDRSVMSLGVIELTSQDIQRRRPAAIQVMYGTPPLQCNQCGYRCPKSADAQKKMDSHLDWHFRQNRRMKDKAKKSHSRSWLVGEEDWIHSREGDLSQSQQPVFFDFASGVNKTSKDEQALQEEIAAMKEHIVSEVTLAQGLRGDETETITYSAALNIIAKGCSICKEKFIKVWNEAEEEWSYKNAVVVDKTIYHATCHADLVRSTARQAAAAAANAVAAIAPLTPSTSSNSSSTSTSLPAGVELNELSTQMDTKEDDIKRQEQEDTRDVKLDEAPDSKMDHEMSAPDLDLPTSLKRKLEIENEEETEVASKKSIISEDS